MAGQIRGLVENVAGWKLSLAAALSWLVSGLVLMSSGIRHILDPSQALLAELLAMINLTVGSSLALSLEGVLALLSMLVGISVALTGLYLLIAFGKMLLDLTE